MNSMINKAVITGGAAAAVAALGIGPAAATTITGGPNFTTAPSSNWQLTSGTDTITCTSNTYTGRITTTSGTPPFQAGVISNATWAGCTALGAAPTLTVSNLPWALWITGPTNSSGVTPGEIRGVDMTWSIPSLGCTIHVTGTSPLTFTNSSQTLTYTGGALSTVGTGFCPGLGSTGSITGSAVVSATDANGNPSPLTIS